MHMHAQHCQSQWARWQALLLVLPRRQLGQHKPFSIAKIQDDEEFRREEVVLAVKRVTRDAELANVYPALEDPGH